METAGGQHSWAGSRQLSLRMPQGGSLRGPLLYYDPSFIHNCCWCCCVGGRRENPRTSNKATARQGKQARSSFRLMRPPGAGIHSRRRAHTAADDPLCCPAGFTQGLQQHRSIFDMIQLAGDSSRATALDSPSPAYLPPVCCAVLLLCPHSQHCLGAPASWPAAVGQQQHNGIK